MIAQSDEHMFSREDNPAPQAGCAKERDAFAPITMSDIRLVAGEGKLPAWAVLDAANAILRQRKADAQLAARAASPPPPVAESGWQPDRDSIAWAVCPSIREWSCAEGIDPACSQCPNTVETSEGPGIQACRSAANDAADRILALFKCPHGNERTACTDCSPAKIAQPLVCRSTPGDEVMARKEETAEQLIRRLVQMPHCKSDGHSTYGEGYWGWYARQELEKWTRARPSRALPEQLTP